MSNGLFDSNSRAVKLVMNALLGKCVFGAVLGGIVGAAIANQ